MPPGFFVWICFSVSSPSVRGVAALRHAQKVMEGMQHMRGAHVLHPLRPESERRRREPTDTMRSSGMPRRRIS